MPFQRSSSAASTQLLSASAEDFGPKGMTPLPPATVTKSALAESSSRSRNDTSIAVPARKQHHVSFKEEEIDPPVQTAKPRGRNQRASNSAPRSDASDLKDRASEHGSSRPSTSRASSRQSRRDASEGESSTAVTRDSAPSTSSRHRGSRNRSDRRSERSQRLQNESAAKSTDGDARAAHPARSEASASSAKKDARSKDASSSGKRSRQHSTQGILPDLRGQDASRFEAGTKSQYSASSRRDRFSRSQDARSSRGDASSRGGDRQLFDPRRDDPVKFASLQRSQGDARSASGAVSGTASPRLSSAPNFQPQILMRRDPSNTSSGSHLGRNPIIKPSIADIAFSSSVDLTDPSALQAHLVEIKKVYRSIAALETDLQEAHQAEIDRARLIVADYVPPDLRDPSYWINTISQHRQLAEMHSSFLEMTCRPELPSEVQEFAEVRNLPSRLWQTAFHLMLENLRTSLSTNHRLQSNQRRAEILDHLTEFIYYAYSFYSALLESERYKSVRRAWIESLGDLSRYRMAVAGLASSMAIEGRIDETANKQNNDHSTSSAVAARIDDDDDEEYDDESIDSQDADEDDQEEASSRGKSLADPKKEGAPANEIDKASIGTAALGDWDLTEKETWRQTAKGWYAMGITETPSVGRLHHHLGVLSRGENDLRAVYHLTKSLIAAKPFASARDSVLPLFNQEQQNSRLHRDSSIDELFLYLHGILLTRVQLDDFEPVYDRLMARLTRLVEQRGPAGLPQCVWTMMAGINIASLFQYGAQDSLLGSLLLQQTGKSDGRSKRTHKSTASTPTAILVSSTPAKTDDNLLSELPRDVEWDDPSDDESEVGDDAHVISLEAKGGQDEQEVADELPGALEKAALLCFSMHSLTFDLASADASFRSNPYNTTISTFLVSLCQSKKACRMLERFIPWNLWLRHVEMSVSLSERTWPKCLSTTFITAQLLLPEDHCLRGILGLSRHLYDRSLWNNSASAGAIAESLGFDNEVEVLDADDAELYTRTESAWRSAASRRKDNDQASSSLDTVRAYRLAFVARKLAKAARGFDLDTKTSTLSVSKMLLARLARRKLEEEQRQLEARMQELRLQAPAAITPDEQERQSQDLDEDDDFDSDWDSHSDEEAPAQATAQTILSAADNSNPSDEVRALHARSCFLRSLLCKRPNNVKAGKNHERADAKTSVTAQPNVCENVIPGYTVLVVDTNILVIPGDIIAQLIDSRRWMVIIPLAVITELDGLRRNDNEVGREAERAILFLESRIKTHAKCFKVQTSRGNYLTDLSCRSEDIDFTWQGSTSAEDGSPRLDAIGAGESKSVAARNVDEVILRLLAWQRNNFVDRRNLLLGDQGKQGAEASKATHRSVLLTLDRNLRLKAKSRGLASMDDKGAASLHALTAS